MAELLIKAVSATHPDAVKDQRGSYKRGDVVVVMPDGHAWGKEERLPTFVVVKIPGLSVAKVKKYIEPEYGARNLITGITPIKRRRLFRILVDNVPSTIKQQLRTTGEVTVTLTQIRNFIQNKVTLATE